MFKCVPFLWIILLLFSFSLVYFLFFFLVIFAKHLVSPVHQIKFIFTVHTHHMNTKTKCKKHISKNVRRFSFKGGYVFTEKHRAAKASHLLWEKTSKPFFILFPFSFKLLNGTQMRSQKTFTQSKYRRRIQSSQFIHLSKKAEISSSRKWENMMNYCAVWLKLL